MRFLVPILTLKDNGGGAVAMAFVRSLIAEGHDVTVLSSGFHGADAVDRPENAGVRFVISPSGVGGRAVALALFFAYAIAYSLFTRRRVVYTHVATSLIPDFSGRRPLMLAQDLEYRFYSRRGRRLAKILFERITGRCRLVVSSLWLEKFFRRRRLDVQFAADVGISKAFFGSKELADASLGRPVDFLLIAKRGHHKRHGETRAVAEALARRGFRVTLIDQASRETVQDMPATLRVFDAVSRSAMRELFGHSKVFISLSRAEGYGLTPLEALSQGCRVVTTPTPSTSRFESAALVVVTGDDELEARTVDIAMAQLAEAGLDKCSGAFEYTGPFMEDWSADAVRTLSLEGAVR